LSPILVRPVREQLEHDRVIRLLQAKYKRKFDVGINPGNEQTAPVGVAPSQWYPDLVLQSPERSRKLLGIVEVETVESINHLEAMSQWAAFARLKAPFHLYVPAGMVDVAKRFCVELQIPVTEIWAYHALGEQIRFTQVYRAPGADDGMSPVKGASSSKGTAPVKDARRSKTASVPSPRSQTAKPAAVKGQKTTAKSTATKPSSAKVSSAKVSSAKSVPAKSVAAKNVRRAATPAARTKSPAGKAVKPAPRPAAKKPAARVAKRK
jgi:hypothetical protein